MSYRPASNHSAARLTWLSAFALALGCAQAEPLDEQPVLTGTNVTVGTTGSSTVATGGGGTFGSSTGTSSTTAATSTTGSTGTTTGTTGTTSSTSTTGSAGGAAGSTNTTGSAGRGGAGGGSAGGAGGVGGSGGVTGGCTAPPWSSTQIYLAGAVVSLNGKQYTANYWTQGNSPETSHDPMPGPSQGNPWSFPVNC